MIYNDSLCTGVNFHTSIKVLLLEEDEHPPQMKNEVWPQRVENLIW